MCKHKRIATLSPKLKELIDLDDVPSDIRVQLEGLKAHLIKRGHENMIPYMERLPEILSSPDYIGVNPREKGKSAEFIKVFDKNVLVAIKLHKSENFFYVPTMYEIQEYKLQTRFKNGRLKKVDKKK